jgi:glutaredoxin-related protein
MARFGTLSTQYFDDAGDPLISGKIAFMESGTNSDKNTYADIDETILNTNPLILNADGRQPNCFFSGSAKAILYTAADVQIRELDPVSAADSGAGRAAFTDWNALSTYAEDDIVTGSNTFYYVCITTSSQGNNPTSSPTKWSQIKFVGVWNTNETYVINDVAQGTDGILYRALVAQSGNDPIGDTTNWHNIEGASLGANTFTGAQTFNSTLNKFTLTAPATAATLNTRADNLTHSLPIVDGNLATEQLQQLSKSATYTLVLADAGQHLLHPAADTTARIWTIPANAGVAYDIGTAVTFVNQNAGGVITIAITTDTMRLAGAGTTGSRTLAANGVATALKVTATEWIISGTGLT